MSPRPVIFISAVSRELKTARQLVANTLTFLGYEPEWQDIFGAEEGDLRAMLRRRIDASAGVVALIGQRYGAEPPEPDAQFGRVSYTQYEALYARHVGKKVWPLLLDEKFAIDPCDSEPDELRALQHAYRERVRGDTHLHQPIDDTRALELHVHKLRDDLRQFRRGAKRWSLAVVSLLLLLISAVVWLVQSQRQQSHAVSALMERNQKVEHALIRLAEVEMNQKQSGEKLTAEEQRARAYATLEKDLALPPGSLAKELPALALDLYSRPDASLLLRARAAYALNKFDEAEKLSLQLAEQEGAALNKAQQVLDQRRHSTIEALELAGQSAQKQIQYDRALEHFRAAAALTDRERDPAEWARVQHAVAAALADLGRAAEVEPILREVIAVRQRVLGLEHPDTLWSRNIRAVSLRLQGKHAEAEQEHRAVLAISERILGPEAPETLWCRNWLADALQGERKYDEAEQEYRAVLAIRERMLGPEDPALLMSRSNQAVALCIQGKYAESEREHRAVLAIQQRVLGPEHPNTLMNWTRLANALRAQDHYAEAERETRAVLAISQRVLGPEHPDTIDIRSNLGKALWGQRKYSAAEQEFLDILAIRMRMLGHEHPDTLITRNDLARLWRSQDKYAEAENEFREILAINKRVLGPEHSNTLNTWNNLAYTLLAHDRYAEAEQEFRGILAIKERALGPEHADTLSSRNAIAWVLVEESKYAEAETEIRPALAVMERVLSPDHHIVIESRDTLGEALRGQGKLAEAEAEHRAVLALAERPSAIEKGIVFFSCQHLAAVLAAQKKYPEALELAKRAEEGLSKLLQVDDPDTKAAKRQREEIEAEMAKEKAEGR